MKRTLAVDMKKIAFILMIAISLAGGAVAVMSTPSYAQAYEYPPAPPDPYEYPWVGPDTPWVYYNGDWFLNGVLYYFYGPDYGWGPYYAYAPNYIVRPGTWYAPRWLAWYQRQPQYWESFHRQYPYWREHREGQRYNEKFFEEHHHGQGGGWQKGFQGGHAAPSHPEGSKPGPAGVAPEKQHPGVQHEPKPQEQHPGVQHEPKPQEQHPAGVKQEPKPQEKHPAGVKQEPKPQEQHQQQKPQPKGDAKEKEKQ